MPYEALTWFIFSPKISFWRMDEEVFNSFSSAFLVCINLMTSLPTKEWEINVQRELVLPVQCRHYQLQILRKDKGSRDPIFIFSLSSHLHITELFCFASFFELKKVVSKLVSKNWNYFAKPKSTLKLHHVLMGLSTSFNNRKSSFFSRWLQNDPNRWSVHPTKIILCFLHLTF